jgi:hypothetical protein
MSRETLTSHPAKGIARTAMLVFDTEARTDRTQRLTFGSHRFVDGQLVKEKLFYGHGLPLKDRPILERHLATRSAVVPEEDNNVSLLTRQQFVEKLFKNAWPRGEEAQ